APNSVLSSTVDVQLLISDNFFAPLAELQIDGVVKPIILSSSSLHYLWDTTAETNSVHTLRLNLTDAAGNTAFSSMTVTVNNLSPSTSTPSTVAYDPVLKAPRCSSVSSTCDTGTTLIKGRGTISGGAELNRPNTIGSSCQDGATGAFHFDESIDRI